MKSVTREALRSIAARRQGEEAVVVSAADAKEILARESGAPDLVSKMDPEVPVILERLVNVKLLGLVAHSDAEKLAKEIYRLRTERDRMYWATEVVRRRIAELEAGLRSAPDDPWDEVSRG